MSAYGLGLDLGMTSITAAVARGQTVEVVTTTGDANRVSTPALAYANRGVFATGVEAERRAIGSPDRVASGVLDNLARQVPVTIQDASYPPDAVLSSMLHNVLATVAADQGAPPGRLTVTHPTHWSREQIDALTDAVRPVARGSGLQLIPNAVAVAIDHTISHPLADGAAVAVVDIGATGYEAVVVGRRGNAVDLLSPRIERGAIGGNQFDDVLLAFVDREADDAVSALDPAMLQSQIALARLRRDCRIAKEKLSTADTAEITAYLPSGPVHMHVDRPAFEDAIRAQVQVVIDSVARALRAVANTQVQAIVLTGGSTQIPLVQHLIAASTDVPRLRRLRHAAARGAAVLAAPPSDIPAPQAGPLERRSSALGPLTLLPPSPLSLVTHTAAGSTPDGDTVPPPILASISPPSEGMPQDSRPVPGVAGWPLDDPTQQQRRPDDEQDHRADASRAAAASRTGATPVPGQRPGAFAGSSGDAPIGPFAWVGTEAVAGEPAAAGGGPGSLAIDLVTPWSPTETLLSGDPPAQTPHHGAPHDHHHADESRPVGWRDTADGHLTHLSDAAWSPPRPHDHPGRRAGSGRRGVLLLAAAGAAVVIVLLAVYLITQRPWVSTVPGAASGAATSSAADSSSPPVVVAAPAAPPAAPATPRAPSVSVDIPSVGSLIRAGTAPGFAAVAPSGHLVYIANRGNRMPTSGALTVVDTTTDTVVTTIPMPAGPPQYLAFSPDGARLYVSVFTDAGPALNQVAVVDTTTNEVTASITMRSRPFALAVTPDGSQVWVPNHDSGTVSVIDARTNAVVAELAVPANPHWVAFSTDGRTAYTANHDSDVVAVLNTAARTVVAQVPVGSSPHSVAVHPSRPIVATVNFDGDSVSLIDSDTRTVIGADRDCRASCVTVKVGRHPQDLAWAADGEHLYVTNAGDGTVSVISLAERQVTATSPIGASPTSITLEPTGAKAYVTNLDDGTVRVLCLTR